MDSIIICALETNNVGICQLYLGGPLVTSGTLSGIAAFFVDNCGTGYTLGYTEVTNYLVAHTDVKIQWNFTEFYYGFSKYYF